MDRKRVRRGESFGRLGVDRTISNSLKSPNRQRAKCVDTKKEVRFSEAPPLTYICSHFDKGMTEAEKEARCLELWYTRTDFTDFLRERLGTIRLLKVVQGDSLALRENCPDVCLRGLEPYQCNALNHELQCQRQWHQRVVLAEQSLQKKKQVCEPERIRSLAKERSEWACKRAIQLASLDALEVQLMREEDTDYQQFKNYSAATTNNRATNKKNDHVIKSAQLARVRRDRRLSLASAQLGMERLMLSQQQEHAQERRRNFGSERQQQQSSSSSQNQSAPAPQITAAALGLSTRRVPVDLAILKEWNAKFLDDIRKKQQERQDKEQGGVAGGKTQSMSTTGDATGDLGVLSLSDKTAQSRLALQRHKEAMFGLGSCSAERNNVSNSTSAGATSAFPIKDGMPFRRDTLVGLRRNSFNLSRDNPSTITATGAPLSNDVTDTCFRFPVRRDSLSNVHWS